MQTSNPIVPVVGAAVTVSRFRDSIEWFQSESRPVELQDWSQPDAWQSRDRKPIKEAQSILQGYAGPIGIHGPYHGIQLGSQDTSLLQLFRDRFLWALDTAKEIGASHMVIHSPFLFFGDAFIPHSTSNRLKDDIARVSECLTPVLERARSYGCFLVMENVFDKNPGPISALIDALDSESLKASLDVGHAYIHTILTQSPTPDTWVNYLSHRLAHLHLQDSDGRHDRHWTPGEGTLNWSALFKALQKLKPTQYRLILEVKDYLAGWRYLSGHGWVR